MSTEKKNIILGMPHGTAQNRLKKSIIFSLVKQLNLDNCFRCEKTIESVEDLSIEHKKPWINSANPIETFFDLSNIAFSHLKCNVPYLERTYRGKSPNRKDTPEGTSWCRKCKDFLPVSMFYKNVSGRWNGLSKVCKAHSEIEKGRKSLEDFPWLKN